MTIYDRYIIFETLQWLTVGTLSIIGIFFGTTEFQHVLDMMNQAGLPLRTVLTVMILQLPTGLSYCLPAGVVLAVMFVLNRSNRDAEITSLQLLGVSLSRVLTPFILIGLFSSLISFLISEELAPQTRDLSRRLFVIASHQTERPFPNQSEFKIEEGGKLKRIIELGKGKGASVECFVSLDFSQMDVVKLIYARSAEWKNFAWTLKEGRIFELFSTKQNTQMQFQEMQTPGTVDSKELIEKQYRTTLDKTRTELKNDIDKAAILGIAVPPYLSFQYYRRFSHPLSCLFLVLAASPVVLLPKRKGTDFSLLYGGFLVVSFFLLQQICLALVTDGRINALLAAWLPGVSLLLAGLFLTAVLKRR